MFGDERRAEVFQQACPDRMQQRQQPLHPEE